MSPICTACRFYTQAVDQNCSAAEQRLFCSGGHPGKFQRFIRNHAYHLSDSERLQKDGIYTPFSWCTWDNRDQQIRWLCPISGMEVSEVYAFIGSFLIENVLLVWMFSMGYIIKCLFLSIAWSPFRVLIRKETSFDGCFWFAAWGIRVVWTDFFYPDESRSIVYIITRLDSWILGYRILVSVERSDREKWPGLRDSLFVSNASIRVFSSRCFSWDCSCRGHRLRCGPFLFFHQSLCQMICRMRVTTENRIYTWDRWWGK